MLTTCHVLHSIICFTTYIILAKYLCKFSKEKINKKILANKVKGHAQSECVSSELNSEYISFKNNPNFF